MTPCIPENAPFTPEQRLWLNGFLAGLLSASNGAESTQLLGGRASTPVTILYGSQTGTAEGFARRVAAEARQRGCAVKLVEMDKYESIELAAQPTVLIITSTYGDGDPPDNAQAFWQWLASEAAPPLCRTRFSVLALGDTNYPAFCEFGKKCDARLDELGAIRLHPRVDCDVDYHAAASAWMDAVLASVQEKGGTSAAGVVESAARKGAETGGKALEKIVRGDRRNPWPARLVINRLLSGIGSSKEVRHFEISLDERAFSYEAGDALGVVPANCPELVDELVRLIGCDGEEAVPIPNGGESALRLALLMHYDVTRPSAELLRALGQPSAEGRQIVDLLGATSVKLGAPGFVALLKQLSPRLYSISSSIKLHPGEVHLTVAVVRYESHGRMRKGVASTFLSERAIEPARVPIFVQSAPNFRLPVDGSRSVIMIGPGTGIAPFRAFLEERRAIGASGRNWLFFGDQRRATDFLYATELEAMRADGHLARLDLAFSRDQAEKIYVQHVMRERAADVWSWLEEGAHVYVCGDASRMAKDVDVALHEICQRAGGLTTDGAREYVARLKSEKRYQRDIY